MIYTVTFNPAIDYILRVNGFNAGATNRATGEEYYFGGKGINVSVVLSTLGVRSKALGFISGWTGRALEQGLIDQGVETDFITIAGGMTRINVKVKDDSGEKTEETELNGRGPDISADHVEELLQKLGALVEGDVLIISGSVPASMPDDIYEMILGKVEGKGVMTVVDATGDLLLNVLQYKPFLIKPNNDEISEMLGKKMETAEELAEGARELQKRGARNVIVSRGGKGAIMVTEDGEFIDQGPLEGKLVNSVGAGDSMVAGFIAGYIKTQDYHYALELGSAAGSATACSPGLASKEDIEERMRRIRS